MTQEPTTPEVVEEAEVFESSEPSPAPPEAAAVDLSTGLSVNEVISLLDSMAKTLAEIPGAHRARSKVNDAILILQSRK